MENPLKSENQLKKLGHGNWDSSVSDDNKIVIVCWYDNNMVNMASNCIGIVPEDKVRRLARKELCLCRTTLCEGCIKRWPRLIL